MKGYEHVLDPFSFFEDIPLIFREIKRYISNTANSMTVFPQIVS